MPSSRNLRQEVLNEPSTPSAALRGSRAAQDMIFAVIFAFFRTLAEWLEYFRIIFLPAVVLISVVNLYYRTQHHQKNKNNTVGEDLSLFNDFIATALEAAAVFLFLSMAIGGAILSAAIVPAVFLASIAFRWLDHFAQSIYWGVKILLGEAGTKQQEENWTHWKKSLRGLAVFTGAGLVIGLLMLSPVAFSFLIPMYAVSLVQAVGTFILVVNAIFAGREGYHIYKKNNPQGKSLFKKKSPPLDANGLDFEPVAMLTLPDSNPQQDIGFGATQTPEERKAAATLRERYRDGERFATLRENHMDDLLRKMEADDREDGAYQLVLGFLSQAKSALAASLCYQGTPELDANGMLSSRITGKQWDRQKQKRKDKLHAVLLLDKLVLEPKQLFVVNKQTKISDVTDVLEYFKYAGKEKSLFESLFAATGVGATQKLFVVVDAYLTKPKFHRGTKERERHIDTLSSLRLKQPA